MFCKVIRQTSFVTQQTSFVTQQTSFVTQQTSFVTQQTSFEVVQSKVSRHNLPSNINLCYSILFFVVNLCKACFFSIN